MVQSSLESGRVGGGNLSVVASTALQEQLLIQESLPPSKVQNYLSELFRIALCRNDDYNLAASSTIRSTKQFQAAKPGQQHSSNAGILMS